MTNEILNVSNKHEKWSQNDTCLVCVHVFMGLGCCEDEEIAVRIYVVSTRNVFDLIKGIYTQVEVELIRAQANAL